MKLVKGESGGNELGWIGRGVEITGEVVFADRFQVDGKVSGRVNSEGGTLIIGETGLIEAAVDVAICVIYGSLQGDLTARSKVEIRKSGKVHGDVITPNLLVEEGAMFNGVIRMGQEHEVRRLGEVLSTDLDSSEQAKSKGA
jgi:cytoskeletal protein CcmA (bactofilin family)